MKTWNDLLAAERRWHEVEDVVRSREARATTDYDRTWVRGVKRRQADEAQSLARQRERLMRLEHLAR